MKGNCGECDRRWCCDIDPDKCNEWPDPEPIANAQRIRAMSDEELADFLSSIACGRETPWSLPFEEKFCKSCPTVHCTYESGAEDDFHECDFADGKCPHGSDMVWWLQQPAEGDMDT